MVVRPSCSVHRARAGITRQPAPRLRKLADDNEAAMIDLDAALRAASSGESETANTLGGHVHADRFATLVTGELEQKSVLG